MSSFKQILINAFLKVSATDPALDREGGPTAEEARDDFLVRFLTVLGFEPGTDSAFAEVPMVEPKPAVSPAKKLTKEEKEAAKVAKEAEKAAKAAEREAIAKAKEEAKAAKEAEKAAKAEAKVAKAASPKKSPEEKEAAKEAEKAAKLAAKEAEKAANIKAKEEAKAAIAAEKEAAKAAKAASKVPLPASPKAAPNLAKVDPTWRKVLKEADKDHAKELEPELLTYLNALSNAAFHSKTAREHVAEFIAARAPAVEEAELEVVEFPSVVTEWPKDSGIYHTTYYVNMEKKRVYVGEMDDEGELKATHPVGYFGMADFKDMILVDE
jgi:hypothetical protein